MTPPVLLHPRPPTEAIFYHGEIDGRRWSGVSTPIEPRVSVHCIGCGEEKVLYLCRLSDGSSDEEWVGCICSEDDE